MTKTEARAILACRKAVLKALETCSKQLKGEELQTMQAYWGSHIRISIEGRAYGGAPINLAMDALNLDTLETEA
jgi:hypothetical protein